MKIFVDATTLISLGTIGELDLLGYLDGDIVVLRSVREEVTTEPAHTNLSRFITAHNTDQSIPVVGESFLRQAADILDDEPETGDVRILQHVLFFTDDDSQEVAVVSDDRRVRIASRGFGATVTGTIGIIVRAVSEELTASEGKSLVRRVDSNGLHMTGELREKASQLIEDAATEI